MRRKLGQDEEVTSPTPPGALELTYDPLGAFPLLWRWTEPTHDVLTPDELARVRPLRAASATAASDHARRLRDAAGDLGKQEFQSTDENEVELGRWLEGLPVPLDRRVVLSWSPALAVEVDWRLFLSRSSAFWYPGSDDLEVFPAAGGWLLRISHSGSFAWASLPSR